MLGLKRWVGANHVTFILRNKNNSNYIDYQKFSTINVIFRKSKNTKIVRNRKSDMP